MLFAHLSNDFTNTGNIFVDMLMLFYSPFSQY